MSWCRPKYNHGNWEKIAARQKLYLKFCLVGLLFKGEKYLIKCYQF